MNLSVRDGKLEAGARPRASDLLRFSTVSVCGLGYQLLVAANPLSVGHDLILMHSQYWLRARKALSLCP